MVTLMSEETPDKPAPLEPPKTHPGRDLARAAVEGAVENIPVVGGALTGMYRVTHPSLTERDREEWQSAITGRVNDHSEIINELQAFIAARTYRREAGEAGQLSFFRTGMLGSLRKIAAGEGNAEIQSTLRGQLAATEPEVNDIIERLRAARERLSGEPGSIEFAHLLDDIIEGQFGKVVIRERIQEVVNTDITAAHVPELAQAICHEVEEFNRKVIELSRYTAPSPLQGQ
jgi:hypothetical protein